MKMTIADELATKIHRYLRVRFNLASNPCQEGECIICEAGNDVDWSSAGTGYAVIPDCIVRIYPDKREIEVKTIPELKLSFKYIQSLADRNEWEFTIIGV